MNERCSRYNCIVLMTSIIVAVIVNIVIYSGKDYDMLTIEYKDILINNDVNQKMYIAYSRIKHILIYLLLLYILDVKYFKTIISLFIGCVVGMFISVNIYYTGICNSIMLILYFIPHSLIYYILHVYACECKQNDLYYYKKINFLIGVLGILVAGILCESIFSEIILKFFHQYIVTKK